MLLHPATSHPAPARLALACNCNNTSAQATAHHCHDRNTPALQNPQLISPRTPCHPSRRARATSTARRWRTCPCCWLPPRSWAWPCAACPSTSARAPRTRWPSATPSSRPARWGGAAAGQGRAMGGGPRRQQCCSGRPECASPSAHHCSPLPTPPHLPTPYPIPPSQPPGVRHGRRAGL